jgi:hypothetical protein
MSCTHCMQLPHVLLLLLLLLLLAVCRALM